MKKVLLGVLFCAMGSFAFGQSVNPTALEPITLPDPSLKIKKTAASPLRLGKKDSISGWYNWMFSFAAYRGAESIYDIFTGYNNLSMFPDSTVMQANTNETVRRVGTHGFGMTMDPKSEYFDNPETGTLPFSRYTKYNWDSLTMYYTGYDHLVEGSVDTLIFQFYTSRANGTGGLRTGYYGTAGDTTDITAFVMYNPATNLGRTQVSEYRYLLTEKDTIGTSSQFLGAITVPTNGATGISVPANQLVAFTVSYRPGFEYAPGDTLDKRFNPTKKLNHFRPAIMYDLEKNEEESFTNGLEVTTLIRYNLAPPAGSGDWRGRYIPGDAWNGLNKYLYSSFYITSGNVSVEENGKFKGYGVSNVFPNPTTGAANLHLELAKSENVTIDIYNVLGQKVSHVAANRYAAGKHNVKISAEELTNGIYFCNITAGGYSKTVKFTVSK